MDKRNQERQITIKSAGPMHSDCKKESDVTPKMADTQAPSLLPAVAVTGSPNSTMTIQFDVQSDHLRLPL